MRFERTARFDADWRRLSDAERQPFREVVSAFHDAAVRVAAAPGSRWPATLRVKPVVNAAGVWEMTSSFSGPDGRATFEWVTIEGETGIRWRRIGGHAVFGEP
ncbi:hypothetical protein BH23ACT8_BH23ACT8_12640 [soil metagenome]